MRIDDNLHYVFKSLNDVKWNYFKDEMFDEYEKIHECYHLYEYYYAENELYVIRNVLTHEIYFTKAKSPYSAYINYSTSHVINVENALKKHTPKQPHWQGDEKCIEPYCQNCGSYLDDGENPCENCTQLIDWSE